MRLAAQESAKIESYFYHVTNLTNSKRENLSDNFDLPDNLSDEEDNKFSLEDL